MRGLHLTADLHDCRCELRRLSDAVGVEAFGRDVIGAKGLTVVGFAAHAFPAAETGSGGITATFMLAESHVCLHTWPEQRAVTLDVYVCNSTGDHSGAARDVMAAWIGFFAPERVERHELQRGMMPP